MNTVSKNLKYENNNQLKEYIMKTKKVEVKLNLGCGGVKWKDFINVDLYPVEAGINDSSRKGCVADVYVDIRNLNLENNSVDEIFSSHSFEHFTKWESEDMLSDWYRMLKKGGKCIIETPDFWRCLIWLIHPSKKKRKLGRNQIYGNQWDRIDYETHRYVWSPKEMKLLSNTIGFKTVSISHKTETHYSYRDMRVVLTK